MKTRFRSGAVTMAAVLLALQAALPAAAQQAPADLEARAKAVHSRALVLDAHVDVLTPDTPARYADDDGQSHASLAKLKAGGVGAVVFALAVGPGPRDKAGVEAAHAEVVQKQALLKQFVEGSNGAVVFALDSAQLAKAHKAGRIAVIPAFQNARSLGKDVSAIDRLHAQGVRVFALTHAGHNDWADSSRPSGGPAQEHGGLSTLGKQAIPKLNRLGVIIDVSQLTPEGVQQVLALSRAPVIASHSGVRSLVENTRNLSDAELDAIGRNGGVVHVPAFNSYLRRITPEVQAKLAAVRTRYGLPPEVAAGVSPNDGYPTLAADRQGEFNAEVTAAIGRASVADLVDHIDYIVRRIGIDHVGIGTDFNHGSGIEGFENEADALAVTRELLRRGYTEEQVDKVWGGNFQRVFREVEAAAARSS